MQPEIARKDFGNQEFDGGRKGNGNRVQKKRTFGRDLTNILINNE